MIDWINDFEAYDISNINTFVTGMSLVNQNLHTSILVAIIWLFINSEQKPLNLLNWGFAKCFQMAAICDA